MSATWMRSYPAWKELKMLRLWFVYSTLPSIEHAYTFYSFPEIHKQEWVREKGSANKTFFVHFAKTTKAQRSAINKQIFAKVYICTVSAYIILKPLHMRAY